MAKPSGFIKLFLCMVLTVLTMSAVTAFAASTDTTGDKITTLDELNGKTIGMPKGSSYDLAAKERLPDSKIVYYPTFADSMIALQKGFISAYITDKPLAEYQKASNPSLYYIDDVITKDDYAFVMSKSNTELCDKINKALEELWNDGTIDELQNKWLKVNDDTVTVEKDANADTSNGTLRIITDPEGEPFSFVRNGEIVGYDIEVATRIAEKIGYAVEFTDSDFSALLPAVMSGKYDIALGCITITEERAESVLFTEPDYYGGTVAVLSDEVETSTGILTSVKNSLIKTFITESRWKLILSGIATTAKLVVSSMIAGTVLGFFFSFMLRSKKKYIRGIGKFLSTLLNGMPMLIILMTFYYIIFSKSQLSAVMIAIFAFSLHFANVVAGLLNTGISAVDKGELEAAEAMGYSKWQIFMKITFPQAAKQMAGQYNGAIVGLIKGTSVVGYITVLDLTKAGDFIRSRTYEAFFPLIMTALIYFMLEYIIVMIIKRFEIHLDPKRRPRRVKGVDE